MSDESIFRCLVRVGSTGWMGIFGSIHPISLRGDDTVVISTPLGEFLGSVVSELSSPVRPSEMASTLAGELLRIATADEIKLAEHQRVWCQEQFLLLHTAVQQHCSEITLIDCERTACDQHLIIWFFGNSTAALGPLSVKLAERWQLVSVQFVPLERVRALTEKKEEANDAAAIQTTVWSQAKEELASVSLRFSKEVALRLQEHGVYQQKLRQSPIAHPHSWPTPTRAMIRIRNHGSYWTSGQIAFFTTTSLLAGVEWLRPTTRQGWQLYGVAKSDVASVLRGIEACLLTSRGSCGNHPRSITCCPLAAMGDTTERYAHQLAIELDHLLQPKSASYDLLWFDDSPDPEVLAEITDSTLPHKLKVGISTYGHVCTEVLANDIAILLHPYSSESNSALADIYVGGGLAFRLNEPATFPRLASYLCTVPGDEVLAFMQGLVNAYRNDAPRRKRRLSRLKYWLQEIDQRELIRLATVRATRFVRAEVREKPRPSLQRAIHTGIHRYEGNMFVGLRWKQWGLRASDDELTNDLGSMKYRWLARWYLTTQQDVIFGPFPDKSIEDIFPDIKPRGLARHFLPLSATEFAEDKPYRDSSLRLTMACAALPTCSLALTDAEGHRVELDQWLEEIQAKLNLPMGAFHCRVSGCANNCSRPLLAHVGLIAHSPDRYGIYVGGSHSRQRLARYTGIELPWGMELKSRLLTLLLEAEREALAQGYPETTSLSEILEKTSISG
jgi:sulfite reductase (ferredoxin)